ncbi:FecR family protein [Pedobacter cryoconitis]|uniref:FecR family protein n=1 Tax=Pedobacter cryoconitis TaxID=188932 RepID=A0A327SI84_9SPHI|nr:FecR domain-containing protein [Pedobacter cryoconitis]RAJ28182.1 FecR family protein [Pedobacter cryoconitis]
MDVKDEGEEDAQASSQRLKLEVEDQQQRKKMFLLGYQFWAKIAAVFLFFGVGAWLYSSQFSTQELLFLTKDTAQADTLTDGSIIVLNKHSLLRYPEKFRGNQRQVWLTKGEAFFTVAPDLEKPFIIHTGSTTIKVAGTSFNVKNRKGSIEVIVEKGTVQVSKSGKMITLSTGEKVLIKQSTVQLIKENNADKLYTYYRSGEFIADGVPLWRMVEMLNEVYSSNLSIGKKGLKNRLLTGTLKNESLEAVLAAISRNTKLSIKRKNNQIILY